MNPDVIVIGGGIAGSAAGLAAARRGAEVALLTKLPGLDDTNTRYAQGGIVYTGLGDSPELLVRDILEASAGAGSQRAAEILATEGPLRVRELLIRELGVPFDREGGGPHLTREGAHSVPRILHYKDSTGWAIQRALTEAIRAESRITPLYGAEALELAVSDGRCVGVQVLHEGKAVALASRGVVLATGGLGALYKHTTNPPHATGDGIALALQVGVRVRDLHYVQFHPTALYVPGGDRFLISEALRGEGAVLLDNDGREFVRHPRGSLAPRDVVAREVWEMMQRTGAPCAYLDVSHRSEEWLRAHFPTIYARCEQAGLRVPDEPIPVVPAAHYSCGGVATDVEGRTSLRGLWAAGEVAHTGLHGANRLASTSLLEGLVFGWRAGESVVGPAALGSPTELESMAVGDDTASAPALDDVWARLREVMWERAGLVRSGPELAKGLAELRTLERATEEMDGYAALRLRRCGLVARRIVAGALADRHSRGCHHRRDSEEAGAVADIPR